MGTVSFTVTTRDGFWDGTLADHGGFKFATLYLSGERITVPEESIIVEVPGDGLNTAAAAIAHRPTP